MDEAFLSRALKVTAFNLSASDFATTDYKEEIRHLFREYFFDGIEQPIVESVEDLNGAIATIKGICGSANYRLLHNYSAKGLGPGEVSLYFLLNDAVLGGGSSSVDLNLGDASYEVKAIRPVGEYATDFKLSSTVQLDETVSSIKSLYESAKGVQATGEIPKGIIQELKAYDPIAWSGIEQRYAENAYQNYFSLHPTIFINNSLTGKVGNIESIQRVQVDQIGIERMSNGTVKPQVKLEK